MARLRLLRALALLSALALSLSRAVDARHGELPNRIPESPPYDVEQAGKYPPPYDHVFAKSGGPQVCASCHERIFDEWNGSMMANAWRDPAWRGAFFLIARLVSTDGSCDIPPPPDGTPRSKLNPFANDDCSSTYDLGTARHTTEGSGSLLDGFCSRCHMPANYIDAVKPRNITRDSQNGLLHGLVDPDFDPTSARGGLFAFATLESASRNSEAGKLGITCTFCHAINGSRATPFHNHAATDTGATPAGRASASQAFASDLFAPPDAESATLGFFVGAGAYRVSPRALVHPERFGPLARGAGASPLDAYLSSAFQRDVPVQRGEFGSSIHTGSYSMLFERAEMCASCHDVTNPLTIKNRLGRWVGGFPIERTYSEWASSRYADRPGNRFYDASFKRDCQTCHMQQHFGAPGTAQTEFDAAGAIAPLRGKAVRTGSEREPYFSHHFVGGNSYSTRLVGANSTKDGKANPYPELSVYSYSSADPKSKYYNAYWENAGETGPVTHHARMAWDRLRHALDLRLSVPVRTRADGATLPVRIEVTNSGTGHAFPTGFPEGRNAWVALRAYDLATGDELTIEDSFWKRRSLGVGYLTSQDAYDPSFPNCRWKVPAGSPDPFAWQFRAVASLGDGCPTLDLPYATPLNLVVDARGLPRDANQRVIDRNNPLGLPQFRDLDRDGDLYDDSFLIDNRLRPLPHAGARLTLDRYAVLVPEGTRGPVSVVAAVYYQSMEAVVAKKFLGNLADTDEDHVLEPCVLRGPCDGRSPTHEPAVVEGSPPVPLEVEHAIVNVDSQPDRTEPALALYPDGHRGGVMTDVVPKLSASEPVTGIDEQSFRLLDARGLELPGDIDLIDDYTFAFFPDRVLLAPGETYQAVFDGTMCDFNRNCAHRELRSSFTVSDGVGSAGDTRAPVPSAPSPSMLAASEANAARTSRTLAAVGFDLENQRWTSVVFVLAALAVSLLAWLRARLAGARSAP